jgi:hypothetical protein
MQKGAKILSLIKLVDAYLRRLKIFELVLAMYKFDCVKFLASYATAIFLLIFAALRISNLLNKHRILEESVPSA